jgi:Rad3-related DNA helicase
MLNYNAYLANVKLLNKGIFMCLSRGKMSEQLDYKDNLARACLIIGIPYLLVNDPRVNLKKTYLDDRHEIESELTMLGYKTNNDPKST